MKLVPFKEYAILGISMFLSIIVGWALNIFIIELFSPVIGCGILLGYRIYNRFFREPPEPNGKTGS